MKKVLIAVFLAVVLLVSLAGVAMADKPANKGNGLPMDAGKSYNFNVIGVTQTFDETWTGGQGKRIFIDRNGTTQFYVFGGDGFAINDRNGTDGAVGSNRGSIDPDLAGIILPYDTGENKWDCRVYVRLLGPNTPGDESSFRWKSEYWDGSGWALIDTFTLDRSSKFSMKNSQILADGWRDILWTWDQKNNFRICQFRIFVGAPAS